MFFWLTKYSIQSAAHLSVTINTNGIIILSPIENVNTRYPGAQYTCIISKTAKSTSSTRYVLFTFAIMFPLDLTMNYINT